MPEIVAEILANPAIRAFPEEIINTILAQTIHRRATDPAFLQASDAAFAALTNAKTDQEKQNALAQIRALTARN